MGKAGGIIGLVAGVLGILAAAVTLFLGGVGSAIVGSGADTVIGLGWGGMCFSFLTVIFGAISLSATRRGGIGLIICSVLGAVLGGTLVAVIMVLAFAGGMLAVIGSPDQTASPQQPTVANSSVQKAENKWIYAVISLLALVLLGLIVAGVYPRTSTSDVKQVELLPMLNDEVFEADHPGERGASDRLAERKNRPVEGRRRAADRPYGFLERAPTSDIEPRGEIAEVFNLGSDYTDLQRENLFWELKDKIVQWDLPVFEISREEDGYLVQTRSGGRGITIRGKPEPSFVGAVIYLKIRRDAEHDLVGELTTGDMIAIKGVIKDVSMRRLVIDPAILADTDGDSFKANGEFRPGIFEATKDVRIFYDVDERAEIPNVRIPKGTKVAVNFAGDDGDLEPSTDWFVFTNEQCNEAIWPKSAYWVGARSEDFRRVEDLPVPADYKEQVEDLYEAESIGKDCSKGADVPPSEKVKPRPGDEISDAEHAARLERIQRTKEEIAEMERERERSQSGHSRY